MTHRPRAPAFALLVAFCLCLGAVASAPFGAALAQPAPPPPKLEPLPEGASDPELEPQVTITRKDGNTVEEARVAGRVVWIKVTPSHGRPYFLVPGRDGETYLRRDSLDSGLRVPLWVLFSF
jgi:hypothetical protein